MKKDTISDFMLERYKLGELNSEDQWAITEALKTNEDLHARLEQLDESDRDLRLRYPRLPLATNRFSGLKSLRFVRPHFARAGTVARRAGLAAVIAAGIILPVLYIASLKNDSGIFRQRMVQNKLDFSDGIAIAAAPHELQGLQAADRPKGRTLEGSELSLYLKGDKEIVISNQTILEEGNTVQLAYTVPAGAEYYGVIFSIDGRSAVTMHYPYRKGNSSLLVSGKHTFLNEAYILDDAPDYEIFVMVVSDKPLDVEAILRKTQGLAGEAKTIEEKSKAAFEDYEVETITILKK